MVWLDKFYQLYHGPFEKKNRNWWDAQQQQICNAANVYFNKDRNWGGKYLGKSELPSSLDVQMTEGKQSHVIELALKECLNKTGYAVYRRLPKGSKGTGEFVF